MLHRRLLLIACLSLLITGCTQYFESLTMLTSAQQAPPSICPVTTPPEKPFIPPDPYPAVPPYGAWYGTPSLWVVLPLNGVWDSLPLNPDGYTQKLVWWADGYSWTDDPQPELLVSGERLDEKAAPMIVSGANGVYEKVMGSAMMAGADFPTLGCWEITARYRGTELSYVVWIAS